MDKIKILEGKKNLLISAPHSNIHRRPNLVGRYKIGEVNTDLIVEKVSKKTSCFGIYATGKLDFDPNYHSLSSNTYKSKVKELVESEKIKKFIDIHGIDKGYEVDILIYYKSKFTNSIKFAKELKEALDLGELRGSNIQIHRLPRRNGGESLAGFVASKLRIPALQIEIARYIREDDKLLNSFINNISEYINS